MEEIKARKANIVITEIPEHDASSADERTKLTFIGVQNGDDTKKVVEKLMTKIGVHDKTEVLEVIRIPQRLEGYRGDGPRKVLVKLADPKMRRIVLDKAKDIRNIGNGWEKTYISPDLTKNQRDAGFKLREEKRRRTEAGEKNLIIKNGVVVAKELCTFQRPFVSRWSQVPT